MKIALVVLLIAAVLGALVGTLMFRDPGYILLAYDEYALETSLWFGLMLLAGAYFIVRLVVFVVTRLVRGKGNLGAWNQRRRVGRARRQTVQGLLLLGEGRWLEAKKAFLAAVDRVDTPLVNYLSAARAADALEDLAERDRLLRLAHETTPGSRFAVGITQARLQTERGQYEQALAALLRLKDEAPRNALVLAMLVTCYRALGDWGALHALLPELRKSGTMTGDAFTALHKEVWTGAAQTRLAAAASGAGEPGTVTGLDAAAAWSHLPAGLRQDPELMVCQATLLEAEGRAGDAEALLRGALRNTWHEQLVARYGTLAGPDSAGQLATAERWLKSHPGDAVLQLALGRLCLRNGEWARAREYFEASLKLRRTPETYAELGRLCHALGEHDRGSELLALSVTGLPNLPLPGAANPAGASDAGSARHVAEDV